MSKERRYILLGGAVLLMIGLVYRFYPDIHYSFSFENEIAQKTTRLAKYQRMLEQRNRLESNLSVLEEQLKVAEAGLLSGETSAIAAVEIQNALNEITGQNEIDIRSMKVMKPEGRKNEAYIAVPVQISVETDARGLKNILYGVENAPKALRVDDLKIRTLRRENPGMIQAIFTVTGYMKRS